MTRTRPSMSPRARTAAALIAGLLSSSPLHAGARPDNTKTTCLDGLGRPSGPALAGQRCVDGETRGTHLHTVELASDHLLNFWELSPGDVAVHESAPAGSKLRLAGLKTEMSVLELYRQLAPEAASESVPAALLEAARRAEARQIQEQRVEAEIARRGLQESPDLAASVPLAAPESTPAPDAVQACSADRFGDLWGAQWFLDNFCNEGFLWARWCPTNVGGADTGTRLANWYKTCGMSADFDSGGQLVTMTGYEVCGCWPAPLACDWGICAPDVFYFTDFTLTFGPRQVHGIVYGSRGYRRSRMTGDQPCPRIHFSSMIN
jgi:hypothetical protein